mmetsp:Transcript_12572/g.17919  ORF Transcript_12572/g.17919 Transcript_12572/m.17919 type:complete len:460 (-) Transcript_12572:1055-2434(-)
MSRELKSWSNDDVGKKLIVIIPALTGCISAVSSACIFFAILLNRRFNKKQTAFHRFLLCISIFDFMSSIAYGFSTLPNLSNNNMNYSVWGAFGNTATCTTQGFFLQMGFAAPLYIGCLMLYYLFRIRYNFSEEKFEKKVEPYLHVFSIIYPLSLSITGIIFNVFNPVGLVCWFGDYPLNCRKSGKTCIRGYHSVFWKWLAVAPIAILLAFVPLMNMILFYTVYSQRKKALKSNFESFTNKISARHNINTRLYSNSKNYSTDCQNESVNSDRCTSEPEVRLSDSLPNDADCVKDKEKSSKTSSRLFPSKIRKKQIMFSHIMDKQSWAVFFRSISYPLAFFLTWIWIILFEINRGKFLLYCHQIFYPLQGFFNAVIFLRPKVSRIREVTDGNLSLLKCLIIVTLRPKVYNDLVSKPQISNECVHNVNWTDSCQKRGSSFPSEDNHQLSCIEEEENSEKCTI